MLRKFVHWTVLLVWASHARILHGRLFHASDWYKSHLNGQCFVSGLGVLRKNQNICAGISKLPAVVMDVSSRKSVDNIVHFELRRVQHVKLLWAILEQKPRGKIIAFDFKNLSVRDTVSKNTTSSKLLFPCAKARTLSLRKAGAWVWCSANIDLPFKHSNSSARALWASKTTGMAATSSCFLDFLFCTERKRTCTSPSQQISTPKARATPRSLHLFRRRRSEGKACEDPWLGSCFITATAIHKGRTHGTIIARRGRGRQKQAKERGRSRRKKTRQGRKHKKGKKKQTKKCKRQRGRQDQKNWEPTCSILAPFNNYTSLEWG